jgi:hypothetical protein
LCLALGCTLADVHAMPAAEFVFWRDYYLRRGFPADRIEAAVAIAGAAVCQTWGGKVEPKDLIPQFGRKKLSNKVLAVRMAQLPGAKVRKIPRPDRKPEEREEERPRRGLLNKR